jgi:hypothetical protein
MLLLGGVTAARFLPGLFIVAGGGHSARSPTGAGREPSLSMGIAGGLQAYRDVFANQEGLPR